MYLRNFSWVREGELAVSARPHGMQGLMQARESGVQAIVSLTEAPLVKSELEECGLVSLHLPVEDFTPPSLEQIQTFTRFFDEQRALGHAVLVHCGSGQGRSGTMAACHLVSAGMDPADALAHLRHLRPGSVETDEQEAIIQAWADRIRSRSADE